MTTLQVLVQCFMSRSMLDVFAHAASHVHAAWQHPCCMFIVHVYVASPNPRSMSKSVLLGLENIDLDMQHGRAYSVWT